MRHYKGKIGIGVFVLFLAISGFVAYQYQNKVEQLEQRNLSLAGELSKLNQKNNESDALIVSLKSEVQKRDEQIRAQSKVEQPTLEKLRSEGFKGNSQEIISDLMKHTELIPYAGVLGGTMGFYDEKAIRILTDQWALASFSDGHIGGYMLLKYEWKDGKFSWKVMDSYLL